MKVILNAFSNRVALCLLRNEMCSLVTINIVCNYEGNKVCPGKGFCLVLRTAFDQKLGCRKEGLLEFKQSSSKQNCSLCSEGGLKCLMRQLIVVFYLSVAVVEQQATQGNMRNGNLETSSWVS